MYKNIVTQTLRNPLHKSMQVEVDVMRLDMIHPVVSGNKWFKLKYAVEAALSSGHKGLLSFGGAYSNHLVALASLCNENGLRSAAFIRGEEPATPNHSLSEMRERGMQCMFVSRQDYQHKSILSEKFLSGHSDFYCIPEGGQSPEGIRGAQDILSFAEKTYSHIVCAVGTGTTLAGLINASHGQAQVIGVSALRIPERTENELARFLTANTSNDRYTVFYDYHFGGYAKKTAGLISYMNDVYLREGIPTDFVYTGKMFYAADDLIAKAYFPPHAKILLIHSGGLQGNRSLTPGTLLF